MRTTTGSMMDAAGARPGDWANAVRRVVEAALPDPANPARAPMAMLPLARAFSVHSIFVHIGASQSAQMLQAAATLPMLAFDAGAMPEAMALARAVAGQWQTLCAQWVDGQTDLVRAASRMGQANTVSKFVGQEMNLVQQSLALVSGQATATVRLLENIQVNIAWWLAQRAPRRMPP